MNFFGTILKTTNILGPLSKVWYAIEKVRDSSQDKIKISMKELTKSLEQSVMLTGKTYNTISYYRRSNILTSVLKDSRKAKQILKDKADLLANKDISLFGERFQSYISKTVKSKQKSKELFKTWSTLTRKRPFKPGPPPQGSSGGRSFSPQS